MFPLCCSSMTSALRKDNWYLSCVLFCRSPSRSPALHLLLSFAIACPLHHRTPTPALSPNLFEQRPETLAHTKEPLELISHAKISCGLTQPQQGASATPTVPRPSTAAATKRHPPCRRPPNAWRTGSRARNAAALRAAPTSATPALSATWPQPCPGSPPWRTCRARAAHLWTAPVKRGCFTSTATTAAPPASASANPAQAAASTTRATLTTFHAQQRMTVAPRAPPAI